MFRMVAGKPPGETTQGRPPWLWPRNCCQATRLTSYYVVQAPCSRVSCLLKLHGGVEKCVPTHDLVPFWDARRVAEATVGSDVPVAATPPGSCCAAENVEEVQFGKVISQVAEFADFTTFDQMALPASYFVGALGCMQTRRGFENF